MGLSPGQHIGPYEIVGALGAGGMGEVYRARDTKLDRDVAIKILPELFAEDPERLARFEREAKTLASLNHANIAAIYGIELNALVMELVEGDDLSVIIARGPLPLAEALPIAKQIADALEAAHEQGIVHRDLKPANVKVRPNNTVKVLDFGLAKAMDPGGASGGDAMNSPTLTAAFAAGYGAPGTQVGMIIGTAAYMAPEQAKGKVVDKRADVWAFGVVLYEMLTGRRAFAGDDVSETLASVLKDTPSIASLPADVPPSVRRLLRRCLEKDRTRRLDSMAAARLEIEDALAGDSAAPPPAAAPVPRRRIEPAMLAGAIGLALVTGAFAWWLKPAAAPAAPRVARYSVMLPAKFGWSRPGFHSIAISPDGTHLAYVADSRLFLRKLDQFDATPISSVNDPREVFFSSDSEWVGFFADGKLQKVAITGGAPIPLCPISVPLGASWTGDVIAFGQETGLHRVSANGGTPELIVPREGADRLTGPQLLPGGEAVLYTKTGTGSSPDEAEIVVEHLATDVRTVLVRGGKDARYHPDGYIIYGRAGEILAVPIDLSALKVGGTPVSLVTGVLDSQSNVTRAVHFGVSAAGTLVYATGTASEGQLVWADFKGGLQILTQEKGNYFYPRVSPDGSRVAFSQNVAGNTDVFVLESARNSKIRLTKDTSIDDAPVWSPDSKRIAYSSGAAGGTPNLYVRAADGSGSEERLTTSPNLQAPFSWSKDGQTLFYVEQDPKTANDIHALPMSGDRKPRPLVTAPFDERRPALSPDGRWLAYASSEQGTFEIHVRPYPDVNRARYQASAGGGTSPLWAPDSRAIFYRQGTKIFRVSVTATPEFKAGTPEEIRGAPSDLGSMSYDLAPDGKRFALKETTDGGAVTEYRVVLNWIEDVKARVGPKR